VRRIGERAMTAVPHAYIRRSATGVSGGDLSRDFQTETVTALADHDPSMVVISSDWGKSASRQKRAKRTGFTELLEAVRDGRASAIYAYAADRLSRDTEAAIALLNACETARIPIITREGTFAPGDRSARLLFGVQAMTNEDYSSQASEKRHATVKAIRARNVAAGRPESEGLGVKPYGDLPGEDLQAVIDAFEATGSYNAATRLLNEQGVKPRRGAVWQSTSVIRIVKRWPYELSLPLPVRKHKGSRTIATHTFARLLVCPHDGATLTASNRADRKGPAVGYFCPIARVTKSHPRPGSVSEQYITAWAKETLSTVFFAQEHRVRLPDVADQVASLQARRRRTVQVYMDGNLDEASYHDHLTIIDADLERLEASQHVGLSFRMGLDWTMTPRDLNARLRELVYAIHLNDAMRVRGAVWLIEPTLPDPDNDEEVLSNPDAVPVTGGWWLAS
jgi:DNA invertase Pin-like site-specific DNA recombinase